MAVAAAAEEGGGSRGPRRWAGRIGIAAAADAEGQNGEGTVGTGGVVGVGGGQNGLSEGGVVEVLVVVSGGGG